MEVICCPVGMIGTNCYIAYDPASKDGFIVDPGDSAQQILSVVEERNLKITHILLTHGHFDHILAVPALKAATGAAICIHAADADMLMSAEKCLLHHFFTKIGGFTPVSADQLLQDGDVLTLAGETVTVLHTPGHTPGSVCYDTGSILFSGDTLFANSCGRCDFPGGSTNQMFASLRFLANLEGDRIVYPGHESHTTLETERNGNYAMRQALAAIR